jgi:hypothetical protein
MISARRTNTAIAVVVALLLIVTIVVAVFGTPTSAPTVNDVTGGTASVTTVEPNVVDNTPSSGSSLTRDADTSDSWFSHTFAVEQFDFPMEQLDCEDMSQYFTLELCVVSQTSRGDFMVTATEGFWDPQDGTDDNIDIPLNFMVYVHTTSNGPARAMSVLDGSLSAPYDTVSSQIEMSTFSIAGEDVVVIEWSSRGDATRATDRTWSALQVVAMRTGGLPEVVATYGGTDIAYAADNTALVLTSERFGPPSRNTEAEPWLTVLRLSPSTSGPWKESVTSQATSTFDNSSLKDASSTSTYEFPRRRSESQSPS